MKKAIIIIIGAVLFAINAFSQTYPDNEDGRYEDMLTPEYYNTPRGGAFRFELNKFVHFARLTPFQHPLEDSLGQSPAYSIHRGFGDGIGRGDSGSHHPASDYFIGSGTVLVDLYAAHDGYVAVSKDVARYRHYLSITTDIRDSSDAVIGKMVTLYGHIDLDLDIAANLDLDGQNVKKGDLVSNHLYSGTVGGPHLHFEIRYYRSTDSGFEDFYGGPIGGKTSPSSGSWTYGFWNPNFGYGFANPENHLNTSVSGIITNNFEKEISYYPNPTNGLFFVDLKRVYQELNYSIYSIIGKELHSQVITSASFIEINLSNYPSGVYFISIIENRNGGHSMFKVYKE